MTNTCMPVRIALVDRIVEGIGISVGADAFLDRIPVIGRDEAAEDGIHVACVEVDQPGFGVVAFADIALLRGHAGIEALAIGGIAGRFRQLSRLHR